MGRLLNLLILTCSSYENPFLTATSRSIIADMFQLSRQLSTVDIPRPLAVIYTLFRLSPPERLNNPLFRALRVWTDIGDISESESFGKFFSIQFDCIL